MKRAKFEVFRDAKYFEYQIGYDSANDVTYVAGICIYPSLGIEISIHKFVIQFGIKLDNIWPFV